MNLHDEKILYDIQREFCNGLCEKIFKDDSEKYMKLWAECDHNIITFIHKLDLLVKLRFLCVGAKELEK